MNLIDTLAEIDKSLKRFRLVNLLLFSLQVVLVAALAASAWYFFKPGHFYQSLILGIVFSVTFNARFFGWLNKQVVKSEDVVLNFEMQNDYTEQSAFELIDQKADDFWATKIGEHRTKIFSKQRSQTFFLCKSLFVTLTLSLVVIFMTSKLDGFSKDFFDRWVASFFVRTQIEVLRGSKDGVDGKIYVLSYWSRPTIDLYSDNILKITLSDRYSFEQKQAPVVTLLRTQHKLASQDKRQSFQMSKDVQEVNQVEFSVDENASLYIDAFSAVKAAANFTVVTVPIPEIAIKSLASVEADWYDDRPLPIQIRAMAYEPLDHIKLKIISGGIQDEEMVSKFMDDQNLDFKTTYELILEPYLEQDLAEVEIFAEAMDSSPQKYIGRSNSIILRTSSAYGRYRKTLGFLADLKNQLEGSLQDKDKPLPNRIAKLASEAQKQALTTPFFDRIDRFAMDDLAVLSQSATRSPEIKYSLLESLSDFLFEHEMLDDRERDRDFFVAIRHLSFKVSSENKYSPTIASDYERLQGFVAEREFRWGLRVQRIQNDGLKMWPEVKNHLFKKQLSLIEELHKNENFPAAKRQIVDSTNQYQQWLKELEAGEDKFTEDQEKKNRQGVANAQKTLKELQRLQGEISKGLDQSTRADIEELTSDWSILKRKQQSNLSNTEDFIEKLTALSPLAGNRITVAAEAMRKVLGAGADQDFVNAESNSDIASRLLRQAEKSAGRKGQKKQSRGRRRRVGNDKYYGKTVVGGDVRIRYEYQVDSRYREDILKQVEESDIAPEDAQVVEDYIKTIVR